MVLPGDIEDEISSRLDRMDVETDDVSPMSDTFEYMRSSCSTIHDDSLDDVKRMAEIVFSLSIDSLVNEIRLSHRNDIALREAFKSVIEKIGMRMGDDDEKRDQVL